MQKIIIAHEYGDESHFEALYKNERDKYKVEKLIILSKKKIIRRLLGKKFKIKPSDIFFSLKKIFDSLSFSFYRNRIIIFAVAPYDSLMLKYKKVINRNSCIYFTSWPNWGERDFFPKGLLSNRDEFLNILKSEFESIAFVNKQGQNSLGSFVNLPSVLVSHSIETSKYRKKSSIASIEKIKILFLGKLIERKGLNLIFEKLKNIDRNDFTIEFWGSGNLKDVLIQESLIDSRIIYNGKHTKEYIRENLCNYDYLLLPSSREPFGIVLIEAMAAGVPCIVRRNEGSEMLIENGINGLVFNSEDEFSDILIKAINLRINNLDEYNVMCKNALLTGTEYDTDFIYKKWEILLDNIKVDKKYV